LKEAYDKTEAKLLSISQIYDDLVVQFLRKFAACSVVLMEIEWPDYERNLRQLSRSST
jgi:hypothetical protein